MFFPVFFGYICGQDSSEDRSEILWNSGISNIFWNNTETLKCMTDVHNAEAISVCIIPNAQDFI